MEMENELDDRMKMKKKVEIKKSLKILLMKFAGKNENFVALYERKNYQLKFYDIRK